MDKPTDTWLRHIAEEVARARSKHPPFASLHEGYAVLLEEVDELWDAIKWDQLNVSLEAVQVAAMALRILIEFGDRAHYEAHKPGEKTHVEVDAFRRAFASSLAISLGGAP